MAKKNAEDNPYRHADGHALIDGARWHYPKTGEPSVCAVKGCDRVLTRHLKKDVVDEMEPAEEADVVDLPETAPSAGPESGTPLAAAG